MMKILYAIQGTGNGHLCRAMEVLPALRQHGEVDVLVSGTQSDIDLGHPVHYKLYGISFIFGKKGGVDIYHTWKRNKLSTMLREIRTTPVADYDLVVNDFEPITAWACLLRKVPCISVSHQAALSSRKSPQPSRTDWFGKLILQFYAPAFTRYGFHFDRYDERVFTPIIRKEIRQAVIADKGHYTVYLPAYSDQKIIRFLLEFPDVQWQVFSKHTGRNYFLANIRVNKLNNERFIRSMATSKGVICGAGFETPSEALFLGKKLLVVPMKSQFEQHCNAAALEQMNVPVIRSLRRKHLSSIRTWIDAEQYIPVNYPDETGAVVDEMIREFISEHASISYGRLVRQLVQQGLTVY